MNSVSAGVDQNNPAFAPLPGSIVFCPMKRGEQIAVGRCVEWQSQNGCSCKNSDFARAEVVLLKSMPESTQPTRRRCTAKMKGKASPLHAVPNATFLEAYARMGIGALSEKFNCGRTAVRTRMKMLGLIPRPSGVQISVLQRRGLG